MISALFEERLSYHTIGGQGPRDLACIKEIRKWYVARYSHRVRSVITYFCIRAVTPSRLEHLGFESSVCGESGDKGLIHD